MIWHFYISIVHSLVLCGKMSNKVNILGGMAICLKKEKRCLF